MRLPLILREEAELDLLDAARWYEERVSGLGAEFINSVDDCLEAISRTPEIYPVVHRRARMALLRRFPYLVIYRILPECISVVAVMHGSRHPRRWKSRAD